MANPAPDDLRSRLNEFKRYRNEHLSGDEKGESQVFLDRLFQAFGHGGVREAGATLEMRIKKRDRVSFADLLWKPRCLIEMKKAGSDLSRHYRQAFDYWINAVPNRPRFVILCNFDEFWIYDFDAQLDAPVDRVSIDQIDHRYDALSFLLPVEVKPIFHNDLVAVTREAAAGVARVFSEMHERGVSRTAAQRFVLQSVMAMFSEDIGLLPSGLFTRALDDSLGKDSAYDLVFGLFREMNTPGVTPAGRYRGTPYFNGGLFSEIFPVEPTKDELEALRRAAETDWSAVRPEIFGTLSRAPWKKARGTLMGPHFTSQADIVKIVNPVIVNPWRERIAQAGTIQELQKLLLELANFKVLDPACGSGNFLYVAYRELRRIENEIQSMISERRRGGLAGQTSISGITGNHFLGLDSNPFAVEMAKVTMMLAKKLSTDELDDHEEVLPLENLDGAIRAADALFTDWPQADVVIGNPPFLGRRRMIRDLGPDYCARLAERFPTVSGVSDFVTYWFPLAHAHLPAGGRAGLVATNTIRQNHSRRSSLDHIVDNGGQIFEAVSSQPWSGDAVVHVSLVNWLKGAEPGKKILWLNDGQLRLEMDHIPTSLSPGIDVTKAAILPVNKEPQVCFQGQTPGVTKGDGFVLDRATRRRIVVDPRNRDVVHPYLGGREMLHDTSVDRWVIDIPETDSLEAEARYPTLMSYLRKNVLPKRQEKAADESSRNTPLLARNPKARVNMHHSRFLENWWRLNYRRGDMLAAISSLDRYIATSRVASINRRTVVCFVDASIRPGDSMTVFSLDDDYSFGVLSSCFHDVWTRARCSSMKSDPRYTSTTVWDTFPWPQNPSREVIAGIVNNSSEILKEREKYLDRGVSLERQYESLNNPGNNRLKTLHESLDRLVAQAYGFSLDEDPLAQLYALNQDLAASAADMRGPGSHALGGVRISDSRVLPPIA